MLRQNKKPLGGANAADGNCSPSGNKNKGMQAAKRNDMIFYIVMLAFPLVQFAVMYVGVNTNVILLAFKSYDSDLKGYFWSGFVNFSQLFSEFSNSSLLKTSLINSLKVYAVQLFVSVPLCLLFSYYIFKKMAFSNFFKIFLFLPSVISSIVMTMIFKYFVERALPEAASLFFGINMQGLLANSKIAFGVVIFYSTWISFGVSLLMYVGGMSCIDDSVLESAQLEGVTPLQEFFRICLPLIYPTLSTFLVVNVAQIFSNQANVFSFFGDQAYERFYTIGYWLYVNAQRMSMTEAPKLSAMGMILTIIALPLTLLIRYLLEKFGPSEN